MRSHYFMLCTAAARSSLENRISRINEHKSTVWRRPNLLRHTWYGAARTNIIYNTREIYGALLLYNIFESTAYIYSCRVSNIHYVQRTGNINKFSSVVMDGISMSLSEFWSQPVIVSGARETRPTDGEEFIDLFSSKTCKPCAHTHTPYKQHTTFYILNQRERRTVTVHCRLHFFACPFCIFMIYFIMIVNWILVDILNYYYLGLLHKVETTKFESIIIKAKTWVGKYII